MKQLRADIIHLIHGGALANTALPQDIKFIKIPKLSVAEWRQFYSAIGTAYLWWEKNLLADDELADYIDDSKNYYAIYHLNQRLGIAEIDYSQGKIVDLAYFGLYPMAMGRGLGLGFLTQVLKEIYHHNPNKITLNTCILDHPNALKCYLKAGFLVHHVQPRMINDPRHAGILPENLPLPSHYQLLLQG